MILVTGGTGRTGGEVAKQLGANSVPFRVIARDGQKAARLNQLGAEIIEGNLRDRACLEAALEGVSKAFLVMPNVEEQETLEKQFVDVCAEKGAHIVYLSSMESVRGGSTTVTRMHVNVEDHIRAKGLPYTMIRPTFFLQLFLGSAARIKETGNIVMPTGDGKVAATDLRDVGEVIARLLIEVGHEGKSYDVSGPELMSLSEIARRFTTLLGREYQHVSPPMDVYAEVLRSVGFPEWRVEAVIGELDGIARGMITHTAYAQMAELLGRPPRSVDDFITDHRELFV